MPILSGQGSDRQQHDDSFKVMSSSTATSRDDGGGGGQGGGGNGLAKSGPQSPPNPRQLLSRLAQAEAAVRLQQQQQQTPPKLSSLGEPSSPFPLSQLASSPLGSPGRDHILLNGKRVSSSMTTMSSCSATSALAAAISSTKTSSITSQDGVLVGAHLKTVSTKISSSISSHVVVKEEEDRGSPSSLVSPSLTIDERSDKENEEDRQKGSSRQDGDNNKKVQNNNTSSYAPGGGRLKFYKDGRCLLELSHRSNGDQSEMWAPVTKKVFWPPTSASVGGSNPPSSLPPTTTTPIPSSTLVKSENGSALSDTTSTVDAASIPSPWHTSAAMLHRAKSDPLRLDLAKLPGDVRRDLSFVMKPPPAVHSIMRKFKHLRKKHRRPYQPIVIGNLLMKMETQAVISRVKRRPYEMDRIKQASRLESFVSKINSLPKKKPIFQIQSWDGTKLDNNPRPTHPPSKRMNTNTHVGNGPNLISTHPTTGVTRVKSELCPVTETCTAATMPLPSQTGGGSRNSGPNKMKAEQHRGSLGKVPHMSPYLPGSQKMMPITAIPARIKSEVGPQSIISSSHVMPDMHRIKMEISGNPGSGLLNRSLPNMSVSHSMSPGLDPREPSFISPRKRLLHHSFDVGKNGSSPAKKHRLSTDSRGSAGSSDGTSSPHVPIRNACQSPRASSGSPFNLPALAASPPRAPVGKSNSFSIDSIMNKGDQENRLVRPRPIPASPARVSDIKRDMDMESNSSRSPTPASSVMSGMRASPVRTRSPPNVQLSTYAARSGAEVPYIDPYVAHLAGVAADPRLGLNHANSNLRVPYSLGSMMNPLFHQQMLANNAVSSLAASQLAAVSGLWTPPVVTSSVANLGMGNPTSQASPLPSHLISTPKTMHGSMMGGDRVLGSGNSWSTPQYRGAPRVATPERPIDVSSTDDVPLDLCTKR
ncbi:hypothetical protein TCAL_07841 [Tigriopus californicus]|uniref:Uncharacterized protein n=1 Tax=Tigriopus californicus TaxID=6832 RepID=A0A553PL48_TIGCA|nr:protein hairless-like [Tigriopus californicus]TRY78411.1 hypothetical protein TCAL_07841 [Tigriopus californicus]